MSTFRIIGMIISALSLIGLVWLARDRFEQKKVADAYYACSRIASLGGDSKECLPGIAAKIDAARQAAACDTALLPALRPETRFAASQACGVGVKRLIAAGDASRVTIDDLQAQLATLTARQADAIARAEARATRLNERNGHARQAIASAPRDAGGNIDCDAGCLRAIGN